MKRLVFLLLILLELLLPLQTASLNSQSQQYAEIIKSFLLSNEGIKNGVNIQYTTLILGQDVTRGYLMKSNYSYIEFDVPPYPVVSLQAMAISEKGKLGLGIGNSSKSYYAEVDIDSSTFYLLTPSGLVYSTKLSEKILPYQTFTIIIDSSNSTAYLFLGNKMIGKIKGEIVSVSRRLVYSIANNGSFLIFQVGAFQNMEILLIQNAISQAINYILGMTTVFAYNNSLYAVTSEYSTPSLSFVAYLRNGTPLVFIPGAPDDGYYGFGSTSINSCYITTRNESKYVIKYEGYCNNLLLFRSYEIINITKYNYAIIVNFSYINSNILLIYPSLANHLISFQKLGNKFILNISFQKFFPILNLNLYLEKIPAYKALSWYFHSFRVTFRHVGELMTFLTNESSSLKSLYPYFYNTVSRIQSTSEIKSFYAPIFFINQGNPLSPYNFYDAYNNSWYKKYGVYFAPLAVEYIKNGIPPLFYPYKSGAVIINPYYGARDYSLLLNESVLVFNASYKYKYAFGFFDPLPIEILGIWSAIKGDYNASKLYLYELINYYEKLNEMCWSVGIYINGNYVTLFSDYNNNTLRMALALELSTLLASKSVISWNYTEPFLNFLLSAQWKGYENSSSVGLQPTFAGGFMSAVKGKEFSPPRLQIIDQVVLLWGGINPYNVVTEGIEYPSYIVSNSETTIVAIQALATYLYLKYGIPPEYSLNQMFAITYPN